VGSASVLGMEKTERDRFLAAAQVAGALAVHPDVAASWSRESACAGLSVGGLAHHLASQLDNTVELLGAGASDQSPIPITEHYARAAWVRAGPEGEANVGIREGSDAQAASGPGALPPLVARWLDELPGALDSRGSDDPVLIPWQGWSLAARDFLVTRMMEIVVHSDDLAASIDQPPPEFPDDVLMPVLGLLTTLSLRRHGQAALVRALSRPQRGPSSISAF
jgi:Mycothiol maleylpyruvate isomerase N-terminal domain